MAASRVLALHVIFLASQVLHVVTEDSCGDTVGLLQQELRVSTRSGIAAAVDSSQGAGSLAGLSIGEAELRGAAALDKQNLSEETVRLEQGRLEQEIVRLEQELQVSTRSGIAAAVDSSQGAGSLAGLSIGEAELRGAAALDKQNLSEAASTLEAYGPVAKPGGKALAPGGPKLNSAGDVNTFLTAVFTNTALCIAKFGGFLVLRKTYPMVFSHNVLLGITPKPGPDVNKIWGWPRALLMASTRQIMHSVGLDAAMLVEFSVLAMKITATIGFPMFFIEGGLNYFCGGHAAGDDVLSYLSYGNVEKNSWLYSVAPIFVWLVLITTLRLVMQAQRKFIQLRMEWLSQVPKVRSNTVLVQAIPDEYQSDEKLKEYFQTLFPDKIKSAYCVKDTSALTPLTEALKDAKRFRYEAKKKTELTPGNPPTFKPGMFAAKVNAEAYWADQVAILEPQVREKILSVNSAAGTVGSAGGHCTTGFVTFKERQHAEVAIQLQTIDFDTQIWQVEVPPEPTDILWGALTQDPSAEAGRHVVGYLLLLGVFFAYIPLILGISHLATSINMGPIQPLWAAFAPTLGLTLMVMFLPTILHHIFKNFFTIVAGQWSQHKIQVWYFWFQVVFVILSTAVGQNTLKFVETLATKPVNIFLLLADTMPHTTHFYMNYIVLQWAQFCLQCTRWVNVLKFIGFRKLYDDEDAKAMAEPEDQDYYGQGSRAARFNIALMIPLVFGTCSPPVWVVSFILFFVIWVVHGYSLLYAESKKPDLGGIFWVTNLRQIYVAMGLYIILMAGVLYRRATTIAPAVFVGLGLFYIIWSKHKFESLIWQTVPYFDIMHKREKFDGDAYKEESPTPEYMQSSLVLEDFNRDCHG